MAKKLNANERKALRDMALDVIDLRYNWQRRFRNALLGLALSDPQWIMFVEKEIHPETMKLSEMTRLIEARARFKILKNYEYIRRFSAEAHFRDTWVFTDNGSLGSG
jgi:hypothetical protein